MFLQSRQRLELTNVLAILYKACEYPSTPDEICGSIELLDLTLIQHQDLVECDDGA